MTRGPNPRYLSLAALVLAVICEAAFLLGRWDAWRDSQLSALLLQAGVAALMAPLAAAELNAVGRSAPGVTARVQRRDRASALAAALRVSGLLLAVHLVAGALMLIVLRADGLRGGPPLLAALPAVLMIPAFALVGAAVGWRVRSVAAAPIAAAIAFAVLVPVAFSAPSAVLEVGTGYDPLIELRPGWVLLSGLSAVLIGVAGLAAMRGRRGASSVVVAALAAVVGLVVIGPPEAVRAAGGRVVCEGQAPTVCAYPERRGRLAAERREIVRLLAALDTLAAGAPAPARFTEGPGRAGPDLAPLELVAPADRATLVADVGNSLVRCAPGESVDPILLVWLAEEVYGPGAVPGEQLGYAGPTPSLERKARAAVRASRRQWCP